MTASMRQLAPIALVLGVVAGGAMFARSRSPEPERNHAEQHDILQSSLRQTVSAPPRPLQRPTPADARTTRKYRYLFETIDEMDHVAALLALLQSREDLAREAADDARSTAALEKLDASILSMLPPAQHALFTALRDSDAEQRSLGDFTAGLADSAPIDESQRRELLLAKLRQKQQYRMWLDQSGLDRGSLSVAERSYAHELLAQALSAYRDHYLQEIRPYLDEEQFRMLSDYEHTEFELELQRVQQSINER